MDVATKLVELERRAAALRLPVTVQRRAALKALVGRSDHPTADTIYQDVVRELPGVSKATVYRALDNFVQLGLARRVHHGATAARFDGNVERHHHLLCVRCESITDIDWNALDVPPFPEMSGDGFEVHDVAVSVQGLCRACVVKQKTASSPHEV